MVAPEVSMGEMSHGPVDGRRDGKTHVGIPFAGRESGGWR